VGKPFNFWQKYWVFYKKEEKREKGRGALEVRFFAFFLGSVV
jgi:hypothetical protein